MGNFLEKIAKRIANAKGGKSAVADGLTMTGDTPNAILINPDIQMRTEAAEYSRHHVLFWGRVNPPHAGHEKAYNKVKEVARKVGGTSSMVLTRTQDNKKNPLSPEQKENEPAMSLMSPREKRMEAGESERVEPKTIYRSMAPSMTKSDMRKARRY